MTDASTAVMISTVLLSWNRPGMLERTLTSYRLTTRAQHELVVVDNGSDRDTRTLIEAAEALGLIDAAIFVTRNEGGESLNYALPYLRGPYVHFSENDIEYRRGWDADVLAKFSAFQNLGQLSPFGPEPEIDKGEIWVDHEGQRVTSGGQTIFQTRHGVGTTCVVRREVIAAGARWTNIEAGERRWPNDGRFSAEVRELGFTVAWNDRYVIGNLGHNAHEWTKDFAYYLEGYAAKGWVGITGLERRLHGAGYEFAVSEGGDIAGIQRKADALG